MAGPDPRSDWNEGPGLWIYAALESRPLPSGWNNPKELDQVLPRTNGAMGAPCRAWQALVFTLTTTLLAGCVSDFPRPPDWAPPVTANGAACPRLDGVYGNSGESAYRYAMGSDLTLSVQLLRYTPLERAANVHLRMAGDNVSDARLEVTVLSPAGSVLRSGVLQRVADGGPQGTFWCLDGVLWLPTTVNVMKDGTGVGSNKTRFGLSLAQDGTLAGLKRSEGVALIGCGFNRSMQHTRRCMSSGGVANETEAPDLLHRDSEGTNVGAVAER